MELPHLELNATHGTEAVDHRVEQEAAASNRSRRRPAQRLHIRPANDILDPVQEGRARRFKQHLLVIGVELTGRETATARKSAEGVGEPGGQAGPLRARREASMDKTAPTRPSQIAASSFSTSEITSARSILSSFTAIVR